MKEQNTVNRKEDRVFLLFFIHALSVFKKPLTQLPHSRRAKPALESAFGFAWPRRA